MCLSSCNISLVADPRGHAVYGRSITKIAGSNAAEGMDICLLCLSCVVQVVASAKGWSLVQGSPNVCVCVSSCVWSRNRNNEPA
jgi:hypothetical protein